MVFSFQFSVFGFRFSVFGFRFFAEFTRFLCSCFPYFLVETLFLMAFSSIPDFTFLLKTEH